MRRAAPWCGLLVALVQPSHAATRPGEITLRMATMAPAGSDWAQLLERFDRDLEQETGGRVHVKWYLGGIAGDEVTALERAQRGQLDGIAGAVICERIAPSLRVLEIMGLATSHDEADALMAALAPRVAEETRTTPLQALAVSAAFGPVVVFSRDPVRSLADLRSRRWWVQDHDEVLRTHLHAMGVPVVPLPAEQALRAFEEGRTDGFIVIPTAALAFGYSARARWFTELPSAYLPACLLVSRRALAQLSPDDRRALEAAGANLRRSLLVTGRRSEHELMSYGFSRQGVKKAPMSPAFRAELLRVADEAAMRLGPRLAPASLIAQARAVLDEKRRK